MARTHYGGAHYSATHWLWPHHANALKLRVRFGLLHPIYYSLARSHLPNTTWGAPTGSTFSNGSGVVAGPLARLRRQQRLGSAAIDRAAIDESGCGHLGWERTLVCSSQQRLR